MEDEEEENLLSTESKRYWAGLVAGVASTTAGYPLDVARVRILFGTYSIKNLQNGLLFNFLYSVGKSGLVWPIQNNLQEAVKSSERFGGTAGVIFSGAIGNVIPGFLFNPCSMIKVRYMEDHDRKNLKQIVTEMYGKEGWRAFTKGLGATIARDAVWGTVYFPVYSIIKEELQKGNNRKDQELRHSLIASSIAASSATLCSSVLDAARLFEQKSAYAGQEHTFFTGVRMAVKISMRNFLSTISGVGRVTVTTILGHITFIYLAKRWEIDNSG